MSRKWNKFAGIVLVNMICMVFLLMTGMKADALTIENNSSLTQSLETVIHEKMEEFHIPGAALVLVKNGRIIYCRGYGYADMERGIPVDGEKTLFRVASVSKTVTITALLQLAEQGLIDLEAEVDRYIEWPLKNPYPEPVRVYHLLEHTDGFGTRDINTFTVDPEKLVPLERILAQELTPTVAEPGINVVYGSFGTALAGYLVEKASGLNFADYCSRYLFQPLGMNRSSFEQQLPPDLMEEVAVVYDYNDRKKLFLPQPFLYIHTPPTGGMSTTAADMGRFLMMLLGKGSYGDTQLLEEDTIETMFQRQVGMHPNLDGITHGFMEQHIHGRRILVRDGSGLSVRSRLVLLPDEDSGYFYVQNSGGDEVIHAIQKLLFEEYFPGEHISSPAIQGVDTQSFTGVYRAAACNEYTLVKFLEYLFTGNLKVTAPEESTLCITPLGLGDFLGGFEVPGLWYAVEPMLFSRLDGDHDVAFLSDTEGNIVGLASGAGYHSVYKKLAWYEAPHLQTALLIFFLLVFIAFVAIWSYKLFRGKTRKLPLLRQAACYCVIVSLFNLIGFCGLVYFLLIKRVAGMPAFGAGISIPALVMLTLLLLGAAAGLGIIYFTAMGLRKRWPLHTYLHFFVLMLTSLGFSGWLHYWNLLGFRF